MRWVLGITTVSLFSFSLCANENVESRVSLLECKMKAALEDTVYDCRAGARFASGRPAIDSNGFWVVGDVLYWTAFEGGTEIAYEADFEEGFSNFPRTLKPLSFSWDVGYRIGIGWATAHDNMEFGVLFTRVEPEGKFSQHIDVSELFQIPISPYEEVPVILPVEENLNDFASAHWCLKYSVLDIELARSYFVSRYFYLRPYFGSRTAWIHQKANLSFGGTFAGNPTAYAHLRNDFTGSGLRLGSDSKWFFARHWNLFTGASVSALYGNFTVETGANHTSDGADIASSVYRVAPAAQMQIGLGWEKNFGCNSNQIALNVGYEFNYWWRQNQQLALEEIFGPVYGARQSKDLAFHGMTVDIQLSF